MNLVVILLISVVTVICHTDHWEEQRMKRSPAATVASLGIKAANFLLNGAIRILHHPSKVEYVKFGGMNGARREVASLGKGYLWLEVSTKEGKKHGKLVGDRFVEFLPATKSEPPGLRVSTIRLLEKKRKTAELVEPIFEIYYIKRNADTN